MKLAFLAFAFCAALMAQRTGTITPVITDPNMCGQTYHVNAPCVAAIVTSTNTCPIGQISCTATCAWSFAFQGGLYNDISSVCWENGAPLVNSGFQVDILGAMQSFLFFNAQLSANFWVSSGQMHYLVVAFTTVAQGVL